MWTFTNWSLYEIAYHVMSHVMLMKKSDVIIRHNKVTLGNYTDNLCVHQYASLLALEKSLVQTNIPIILR